jgi:Zn-dependent protease
MHAVAPKSRLVHETAPAQPPVLEGEYIEPQPKSKGPERWKAAGTGAIGLGILAAKFKSLLLVLLNLKWFLVGGKLLLSSFSFLASVWFYALFWGWKFALVFTLLIFVHEMGHAVTMRFFGVPASLPYFIPGFGALITMKGRPSSALEEAYVALAGPFVGTLGALACYSVAQATGSSFWMAAAYTGFFLNLFNLAPVLPLDGGRVVGAISPRIWMFGLVMLVVAAVAFHWFNPLLLILIVVSLPQAIAAWRGQDREYYTIPMASRIGVGVAYFALAGFLIAAMPAARVAVPN